MSTFPDPNHSPQARAGLIDAAKELLSSEHYMRQWGHTAMRSRAESVDDFGLDPKVEARFRALFDFLYARYFRVASAGVEEIPDSGRCIIVANHSGSMPYDGIMLKTCILRDHAAHLQLRWLTEDFITYLPFVGSFMNRIGAVRACQENAERLLRQEKPIAVFPEGVKGIAKLYRDKYKLQRFGRGGFVRLALRMQAPIVPCAILGAEEANPMLFRIDSFARSLGVPYIPITPTFPLLGPVGLLPAPTKWRIVFGPRIEMDQYTPEDANDTALVARLSEHVRGTIQHMLDDTLSERKSVFWG